MNHTHFHGITIPVIHFPSFQPHSQSIVTNRTTKMLLDVWNSLGVHLKIKLNGSDCIWFRTFYCAMPKAFCNMSKSLSIRLYSFFLLNSKRLVRCSTSQLQQHLASIDIDVSTQHTHTPERQYTNWILACHFILWCIFNAFNWILNLTIKWLDAEMAKPVNRHEHKKMAQRYIQLDSFFLLLFCDDTCFELYWIRIWKGKNTFNRRLNVKKYKLVTGSLLSFSFQTNDGWIDTN